LTGTGVQRPPGLKDKSGCKEGFFIRTSRPEKSKFLSAKDGAINPKSEAIISDALLMSDEDRAMIAERLIASLDKEYEKDVEVAWKNEVRERAKDIDSGGGDYAKSCRNRPVHCPFVGRLLAGEKERNRLVAISGLRDGPGVQ
jgi:hypothetical protein